MGDVNYLSAVVINDNYISGQVDYSSAELYQEINIRTSQVDYLSGEKEPCQVEKTCTDSPYKSCQNYKKPINFKNSSFQDEYIHGYKYNKMFCLSSLFLGICLGVIITTVIVFFLKEQVLNDKKECLENENIKVVLTND